MYSRNERIAGAVALAIALAGQINASTYKINVLGFPSPKVSILMYLPLAAVLFWVLRRKAK
jgi:hypothetical protein